MSPASLDARAVVRALDALTTQVRRVADALTTPAVRVGDGVSTTADDGPRCVCGDPLEWYTAPGGGAGWIHGPGTVLDAHKPRPAADEDAPTTAVTPDFTSPLAGRIEVRQPCPWCGDRQMIPRTQFDEHVARMHPDVRTGGPGVPLPPVEATAVAEEQTLRLLRRESLLVLLTRLQRGRTLTEDEAGTLREHVETEMREAETARAEAKRQERLGLSAIRAAKALLARRTTTLRTRAEQAEDLLRVAHETSNRSEAERAEEERLRLALAAERDQWKERCEQARGERERSDEAARRALEQRQEMAVERYALQTQRDTADRDRAEAQAAIERVREATAWAARTYPALTHLNRRLATALDGTEQHTTTEA